jgi:hypothetical protein
MGRKLIVHFPLPFEYSTTGERRRLISLLVLPIAVFSFHSSILNIAVWRCPPFIGLSNLFLFLFSGRTDAGVLAKLPNIPKQLKRSSINLVL